jgi:hypothetical protein
MLNNPGERDRKNKKDRERYYKNRYGLTEDQRLEKFRSSPCCQICGVVFSGNTRPCIDHSHVTGLCRGVLCDLCNSLLGYAKDSPDTIRSAIEYLRAFQDRQSSLDISA